MSNQIDSRKKSAIMQIRKVLLGQFSTNIWVFLMATFERIHFSAGESSRSELMFCGTLCIHYASLLIMNMLIPFASWCQIKLKRVKVECLICTVSQLGKPEWLTSLAQVKDSSCVLGYVQFVGSICLFLATFCSQNAIID